MGNFGTYSWSFEGTYSSNNNIDNVTYCIWLPAQTETAKGIVQIIHGMCEHCGRYDNFASFLTSNGYIVCQNENLGHGRTGGKTLGYMGEKNGDIYLVQDAYKLTKIIKEKYPNKPFYLIGHSMGSFIARQYCAEIDDTPNAVIFSGTNGGGMIYYPILALVKILIKIKGAKSSGSWLNKINGKTYNKKFLPANTGYEWLSRDESVWTAFSDDKMCNFSFTLGGYRDLLTLLLKISGKKWAKKIDNDMPILLLSGLDDPVGDYGRGIVNTYKNLVETGKKNVFIKLYEEGRHEMLNELNKEEVYDDILFFLENGGNISLIDK